MSISGKQITSTLTADGNLTVALTDKDFSDPKGFEVLLQVEAAPINPSDLGLLLGAADLGNAEFLPGRIVAPVPEMGMRAMAARLGDRVAVGNEGAGIVIAAGEEPYAQSLIGKRVTCVAGSMYASHAIADARSCIPLPDGISAEQGAGAFVNPLTALGFVETMRADGFAGIIHTAAASNLGQMLVKLCAEEGIPLVNIVRSAAQVDILKRLGAQHIIDSSSPDFMEQLVAAISATGAYLAFDAIGGGRMANDLLTAMEQVASTGADYSRYGSNVLKKVYIYGMLDVAPTVLTRSYGFTWACDGWLLLPFLAKVGMEGQAKLSMRVLSSLTTTFASAYKAKIGLEEMLTRDVALAYNAKATGEKYLVTP